MYNSEEGGEKPDLRNLRRAMSRFYPHSQIEMHPMGPRDVAKLLGGMGACGLEERCCTGFLTDFSPISIKMAKEQGISLTPTEITGMCGRLRCCLAYEYEQYTEARKTLPKRNKRVLTPQGEGKVLEVLPLKGAVLVMLENEVLHEYLAHEIQLLDDNGVPIPRTKEQVAEALAEEGSVSHPDELSLSDTPVEETKSQDNDIPVQQYITPPIQIPSQRDAFHEHPQRGKPTSPQRQTPENRGNPPPGVLKKQKPGQHQGSKSSDNRQTPRNRPAKGYRRSGQRRDRGR
jgi:hypothetical protein